MQKHKQENAPREYTRDASSHLAFALEKLAVFPESSARGIAYTALPTASAGVLPAPMRWRGVLLNSASPDACEPSGRHILGRYVKDHISEISSQNAVYYTPSPPQKQDGAEIFAPRQTSGIYSIKPLPTHKMPLMR